MGSITNCGEKEVLKRQNFRVLFIEYLIEIGAGYLVSRGNFSSDKACLRKTPIVELSTSKFSWKAFRDE